MFFVNDQSFRVLLKGVEEDGDCSEVLRCAGPDWVGCDSESRRCRRCYVEGLHQLNRIMLTTKWLTLELDCDDG